MRDQELASCGCLSNSRELTESSREVQSEKFVLLFAASRNMVPGVVIHTTSHSVDSTASVFYLYSSCSHFLNT